MIKDAIKAVIGVGKYRGSFTPTPLRILLFAFLVATIFLGTVLLFVYLTSTLFV